MRVAVVAGPDPGHSFPAIALCQRFREAGDAPTLFTGVEWTDTARAAGIDAVELEGLVATDDDLDAGARIHGRAARMAVLNVPALRELAPDLVMLSPPYHLGRRHGRRTAGDSVDRTEPASALSAVQGAAAHRQWTRAGYRHPRPAARHHHAGADGRSWRAGLRQRAAVRMDIGLPERDPGPLRRLIATLPALEVPRPDWPDEAVVVGPLHFEPTDQVLDIPAGTGPVVVVAPSTAMTGTVGLVDLALQCLTPGETLPPGSRLVVSRLGGADLTLPPWAVAGRGRQDGSRRRTPIW